MTGKLRGASAECGKLLTLSFLMAIAHLGNGLDCLKLIIC